LSKFDILRASIRLNYAEWKDLLNSSLQYEFEKRVRQSPVLSPLVESAESFFQMVYQTAQRSFSLRLKVGRLLVRMISAMLNQNSKAFELAIRELLELGRKL
jgi:hypothetical protein